jgi:hypothetical protein
MKILYRISDNSYVKPKLEGATKKICIGNFIDSWRYTDEIIILADRLGEETKEWLEALGRDWNIPIEYIDGGSSAQSFRIAMERALEFPDDEGVYLLEDDYLHLPKCREVLMEGLQIGNYATLYDCVDKYIPASQGGNPLIDDSGGEVTRVVLTKSSHFKLANSTTCTFATTPRQLKEDWETWKKWCFATPEQKHPNDFQCFLDLREQGRALVSPLPGLSTHCEPYLLSPLTDWTTVVERAKFGAHIIV